MRDSAAPSPRKQQQNNNSQMKKQKTNETEQTSKQTITKATPQNTHMKLYIPYNKM